MKKLIMLAALILTIVIAVFGGYYTSYVWGNDKVQEKWVQNEVYEQIKKEDNYNDNGVYDHIYAKAIQKSIVIQQCYKDFVILKGTLGSQEMMKDIPPLCAKYNGEYIPVYCDLISCSVEDFKWPYSHEYSMAKTPTLDVHAYIGTAVELPPDSEILLKIGSRGIEREVSVEHLNSTLTKQQLFQYDKYDLTNIINPKTVKTTQYEKDVDAKTAKIKVPSESGQYRISYEVFEERGGGSVHAMYYFFVNVRGGQK